MLAQVAESVVSGRLEEEDSNIVDVLACEADPAWRLYSFVKKWSIMLPINHI